MERFEKIEPYEYGNPDSDFSEEEKEIEISMKNMSSNDCTLSKDIIGGDASPSTSSLASLKERQLKLEKVIDECNNKEPANLKTVVVTGDTYRFDTKCDTNEENDLLYYNPKMDDEDEKWINRNIRHSTISSAILSCPSCLISVCMECQRHIKYPNQFRALFVMNCKVGDQEQVIDEQLYRTVQCNECNAELGVFDHNEEYHFYNAIPSNA